MKKLQSEGPQQLVLLLAFICSFALSAWVRLSEFRKWDRPELKVGGDYILATPDAYAWVAGASGSNESNAGSPMATFLRWTAPLFRSSPANVAFWAPAFMASLVTIPLVLWSGLLSAPGSAVLIATVGSLVPAFYARTRLGFFDTDWATLFFPLMIAFFLGSWLRPQLGPWCQGSSDPSHQMILFSCQAPRYY